MSKENKKYFWFKFKEDFFLSKEIKLIRKLPSGAEILIVLFKLQLHSLKTGGIIEIDGLCETIEEELSVLIDENKDLIQFALGAFKKFSLINIVDDKDIHMLLHDELIGSETASTLRSRKSRTNKKISEKFQVLQCNSLATKCNTDIEKDIDIEIDKEIDIYTQIFNYYLTKKNLINHKELTEPMRKATLKAVKTYNLDFEYIKRIIDRHSEEVEATKDKGEYKTKSRTLAELFGQKKYQSQDFICVDYLDEIYFVSVKQEQQKTGYQETVYDTSFNDVLDEIVGVD